MDLLSVVSLPERFDDENHLDEVLTRPSEALVEDMASLEGDILVFGASGQLGQTICRLAKRAAADKRVIGVARFMNSGPRAELESCGVETMKCDLFDRSSIESLPHSPNVIVAAGGRFGPKGDRALGWMTNTYVPALIAEIFSDSRLVTMSSGTVYPMEHVTSQGSTEESPTEPVADEFANSCLARERIFQYFSEQNRTPGRIIRLAYAIEVRKGVMQYIARNVYLGKEIDLSLGHVNVIWQGDFASQLLRSFNHCTTPTTPINVTGPETVSLRDLAFSFGHIFGKEPKFVGVESDRIWLVNSAKATRLFGYPLVSLEHMILWTADWVARSMPYREVPFPGQVRWPIPS